MFGGEQPGRQVLRIGIDRVSEEEQLHDRNHDDDAQRHRIANDLNPFLAQKRDETAPGEAAHEGPSFTLSIWMNTSSSLGGASRHSRSAATEWIARSSAARLAPATRSARPKTAAASTPSTLRKSRAASSTPLPVPSKVVMPDWRATVSASPCTMMRPLPR